MDEPVLLLDKVYSDESLVDLANDCEDALMNLPEKIPVDEYGFRKGRFTVQMFWEDDS